MKLAPLESPPQEKSPISALILAKNESRDIARCISALSWCDEVIVIDDSSSDDTVRIAESLGARVVTNRFKSFATQRNWGLEHAGIRNEWVLHIDADEVATPEFASTVGLAIGSSSQQTKAFAICRKTMFLGQWLRYSDGFPVWIMRITRRGQVQFEDKGHGEVAVPAQLGEIAHIKAPLLHFAFSKGIANWIDRHNRYSTAEAALEFERSKDVSWGSLLRRDVPQRRAALRRLSRNLPCRAWIRFFYQFVYKLGFLDGKAGLVYSVLISTYEGWIVLKRRELEGDRKVNH